MNCLLRVVVGFKGVFPSSSSSSVTEAETTLVRDPSVSEAGSNWYTVARRLRIVGTRGVEVADAGTEAEAAEGVRLPCTTDSASEAVV